LQLDSEEDAEYIVAKAIRDGVIDAVIDHEHGYIKSKENVDVYSTQEPQNAFHQRISFCLNLHNESIKVMHYFIILTIRPFDSLTMMILKKSWNKPKSYWKKIVNWQQILWKESWTMKMMEWTFKCLMIKTS
jgi:hypothetical protein